MVRVWLAWLLYWCGHFVSLPMSRWGWPVYRAYNRLMVWSVGVQGNDERGPWREAESDRRERE